MQKKSARYRNWRRVGEGTEDDAVKFGGRSLVGLLRYSKYRILKWWLSFSLYIPKGKVRIGGEQYSMREILIHSAHHHLQHYGTNKTFRTLAKDTIWPGQWSQVRRFIDRCDACQRN